MKPNRFISKLREYTTSSHKVWEEVDNSDVLKLDWNEADLKLPLDVVDAVKDFLDKGRTNWYPDVANILLMREIASYIGLPHEYIQYFEGSDCGLDYIVRTFLNPGDRVAVISPTYDNFRVYAQSVGGIVEEFHIEDVFKPDVNSLKKKISKKIKMIYLVNPNNPTGVLYSLADVRELLEYFSSSIIVLDEAYAEFIGVSAADLTLYYPNLIVSRSLSKAFGLASFRVGYIITSPENIAAINKIRNGKNISAVAQVAAISALKNRKYMEDYIEEVKQSRKIILKKLRSIGFTVRETDANFILVKTNNSILLCEEFAKHKVFIRDLSHLGGLTNYVRITIPSIKSAEKFCRVLDTMEYEKIL